MTADLTDTLSSARKRCSTIRRRIESSPGARRVLSGAVWTFLGSMTARLFQMAAIVISARFLGKEGFGALSIVQATVGSFGVFAGFGLGLTANKHIAEFRTKDQAKAGRILALASLVALVTGTVAAGGLALLAPWLASTFLAAPSLGGLLRVGALVVLFDALCAAQTGTLVGLEAFKRNAVVTVVAALVTAPVQVVAVMTWGLAGAVWAYVAGQGLIFILTAWTASQQSRRAGIAPRWSECWQERGILWRFSLPAVMAGMMVVPAGWVCNAITVNGPGGYGSMGVYGAATRFTAIVMSLQAMLGAALLPMLASSTERRSASLEYFNTLFSWVIGLLIIVPLACFPEIFSLAMGAGFSGSGSHLTFACVLFTGAILAHRQGLARSLAAQGIMWWSVLSNTTWGGLAIGFTAALNHLGHVGRAAAETIAYAINTVIFVPFYLRKNLCPKHLLYSMPSVLAWTATVLACFAPIWLPHFGLRVANLLVCCLLLVTAFRLMWRHRKTAV